MIYKTCGAAGLVCLVVAAAIQFGVAAGLAAAGASLVFVGIDGRR